VTVILVLAVVFSAGCFGGLVNTLIAGEFRLPRLDRRAKIWRPGWIGNVIVGGTAALVFWGLYGPVATIQLTGNSDAHLSLHVGELVGAILTGIGGGRLLTAEVDRRVLQKEKSALEQTKAFLAETVEDVVTPNDNESASQ